MGRLIGLFNKSRLISDDECKSIAEACQKQIVEDVAPAWGMLSIPVLFYPDGAPVPDFVEKIVLFDDSDAAGAGGYHDLGPDGKPYGKVFVGPVLQSGGGILIGEPWSVASVTSHEVIEQLVDPDCNLWSDGPESKGGSSYAYEACDAVEAQSYPKEVCGQRVDLSNFLWPDAFNPAAPLGARLDQMSILIEPFAMSPGGYQLVRSDPGLVSQQFAESAPPADWRLHSKMHPASRTMRRVRAVP